MAESLSDRISECTSDIEGQNVKKMPEFATNRMSEVWSDRMSESMLGRMSESTSDFCHNFCQIPDQTLYMSHITVRVWDR